MAFKLNIADRWRKYVARKSKLALFFDMLFVVLLVLVAIPSTRRTIAVAINRYTLFSPRELNEVRYLSPKAYDFILVSTSGDTLLLSDIKHKVLFVNFWATWCPPCVAELPSMQRLYDAYGHDAAFLFISTEATSTLTQFLDKKGYTIPVYRPLGNIPADFDWTAFPTTFVISKEGRVVIKKVGSAKWDGSKMKEVMERLMGE